MGAVQHDNAGRGMFGAARVAVFEHADDLADLDLVVASGASNKGFLLDVLASDDFRAGPVDTTWLDRFLAARRGPAAFAVEALVAAAVLAYQRARAAARANFYADASDISPDRVPPSNGQVVDLVHRGEAYRLEVYAVGGWGYRLHLDGRALTVTFEEEGAHTGRLSVGARAYHEVHDASGSDLRVEIEGHPHRFGRDTAGQVRAGTPAMIVALHVKAGDVVARGDILGVLEAMKTEIRFDAPVAGVVKEVAARVVVLQWQASRVDYTNELLRRNVRARIARPDGRFYPDIDLYQDGRKEPDDTLRPLDQRGRRDRLTRLSAPTRTGRSCRRSFRSSGRLLRPPPRPARP